MWKLSPRSTQYTPLHRLESHVRTMKSASRQRHPGEKQSPGEEKADRSHAARSGGSIEEEVPKTLCSANASKNCADSKERSLFFYFPFQPRIVWSSLHRSQISFFVLKLLNCFAIFSNWQCCRFFARCWHHFDSFAQVLPKFVGISHLFSETVKI